MNDLTFIQWMQIAAGVAWAIAAAVSVPSVIAIVRKRNTVLDLMAFPILLIAINQIWESVAWLVFPRAEFIPSELFLWTAVHTFSIICAVVVSITYRRVTLR